MKRDSAVNVVMMELTSDVASPECTIGTNACNASRIRSSYFAWSVSLMRFDMVHRLFHGPAQAGRSTVKKIAAACAVRGDQPLPEFLIVRSLIETCCCGLQRPH